MRCPGALPNAERLRCKKAIKSSAFDGGSMLGMIGSGVPSGEHHTESRTGGERRSKLLGGRSGFSVFIPHICSFHVSFDALNPLSDISLDLLRLCYSRAWSLQGYQLVEYCGATMCASNHYSCLHSLLTMTVPFGVLPAHSSPLPIGHVRSRYASHHAARRDENLLIQGQTTTVFSDLGQWHEFASAAGTDHTSRKSMPVGEVA